MRRSLAIGLLLLGCAAGSPGGRARLGGAYPLGEPQGSTGGISLKTGLTPLGWFLPTRDWDVEAGYVLEAFPGHRPLDVQGGYLGVSFMPTIVEEYTGLFRARFVGGLDAEVMGGVDRLVVGGTATVGLELVGFESGADSRGSLGQGYAIAIAGEWSMGVTVFGSYRHAVDEGHYGMIGGGLHFRFPAAFASGYVLPFGLDETIRGETPDETRERHRRRQRMRRERRERGRDFAVICRSGDENVEADSVEEALAICPSCVCEPATVDTPPED